MTGEWRNFLKHFFLRNSECSNFFCCHLACNIFAEAKTENRDITKVYCIPLGKWFLLRISFFFSRNYKKGNVVCRSLLKAPRHRYKKVHYTWILFYFSTFYFIISINFSFFSKSYFFFTLMVSFYDKYASNFNKQILYKIYRIF